MSRCTICCTLIQISETTRSCATCEQEYHDTCWTQIGGCATYGCEHAAVPEKPAQERVSSGWGDSKTCPSCNREIGSGLLLCSCGARFPHADPMTKEEYRDHTRARRGIKSTRFTLLVLFLFSLLGFTAPVLGPIAGILAYRKRDLLAGADGTYLSMGYGAAMLGLTYTGILLMLLAGF